MCSGFSADGTNTKSTKVGGSSEISWTTYVVCVRGPWATPGRHLDSSPVNGVTVYSLFSVDHSDSDSYSNSCDDFPVGSVSD